MQGQASLHMGMGCKLPPQTHITTGLHLPPAERKDPILHKHTSYFEANRSLISWYQKTWKSILIAPFPPTKANWVLKVSSYFYTKPLQFDKSTASLLTAVSIMFKNTVNSSNSS